MDKASKSPPSKHYRKEFDRLPPSEQEALLGLVRIHGLPAISEAMNGRVGAILAGSGSGTPSAPQADSGLRPERGEAFPRGEENLEMKNDFQSILDAIPEQLFEVDIDGFCHSYHSPLKDLLLYPPEAFVGKNLDSFLPADVMKTILSALREAETSGFSFGKQFSLELPRGTRLFEISVSKKAGNVPTRFIMLRRDITDRKQMEQRLLDSEKRLQSIFDVANAGLSITDTEGKFIMFNDCLRGCL
jgi:PAS domain-containing protein